MSNTVASLGLSAIPVTATALGPFALLHIFLAANCIRGRVLTQTYFGSEGRKSAERKEPAKPFTPQTPASDFDPLQVAVRAQGNFIENVPIALITAAVVELSGGDRTYLGYTLAAFWVFRVAHYLGLTQNSKLRAVGFFGSSFSILGLGAWASYLGYQGL